VVYHPLGPTTPLFTLWRTAISQAGHQPVMVQAQVLKRYGAHLSARLARISPKPAIVIPNVLDEDRRLSVRDFRAFFPVFLMRIGAPPDRAEIPVAFPSLPIFDARVVEAGLDRAIFLSSRLLDVVDVFARAVSLNARVFERMRQELAAPSQSLVLPTWYPLMDVGLSLTELCDLPLGKVRETVFHAPDVSPANRTAYGRRRLTHYLAQAMFLIMERLVGGSADEAAACLDAMKAGAAEAEPSLDARYIATVVLTFIVLHEHAHLAHGHNSNEPMQEDPQINAIVAAAMQYAKEHGDIMEAIDLRSSTQRLEQDADCFPFEVISDEYREAVLEAASLWLTALASADRGRSDWLHAAFESKGRAYPQYAMRVWFLNGKYSTGARQGEVAGWVRRTAEGVQAQPSTIAMPLATCLPVVRELWAIAEAEAARPPA
jgi:hypothetical protein